MEIVYADEFVKRFKRLPLDRKKKAVKQEKLFRQDPFHPSLHTEKLTPKSKQLWSFRVDKKYRIIFKHQNDESVLFMTVGEHDWIYKYTNRL
jgi:proteic killer suppression protein